MVKKTLKKFLQALRLSCNQAFGMNNACVDNWQNSRAPFTVTVSKQKKCKAMLMQSNYLMRVFFAEDHRFAETFLGTFYNK